MKSLTKFVRGNIRAVLGIVCLILLIGIFRLTTPQVWFHVDNLRQLLHEHRMQGIAIFVTLFVLGNLLQIPGWIFLAASVLMLGRLGGGLVTYLAASISCTVTFLLVRLAGGNAIEALPYAFTQRLLAKLHRHPVRNTFLLRTVLQTLPALNYALGLSGMRFSAYLTGTLLGLPIPIAAYCLFFDTIARLMHFSVITT